MAKAFVFLLFALLFSLSSQCPNGWHSSVSDDKCYLIVVNKKAWFDAEEFCRNAASDGHLTSIATIVDQSSGIFSAQLWIGASDLQQNDTFAWIDGKPFGSYTDWKPGQPDLSNDCASSKFATTGSWKTEQCGTENCFICESYVLSKPSIAPQTPIATAIQGQLSPQNNISPTTTLPPQHQPNNNIAQRTPLSGQQPRPGNNFVSNSSSSRQEIQVIVNATGITGTGSETITIGVGG